MYATGTATDPSPFALTVNGASTSVGSGNAFSTTTALVLGANTVTITGTDDLGN